ncbi:alpha/beta fold hydrolase [Nannocystis bainbridge]|uniref:Alpha/beta hydrolase n=1 Tax=Nannocystis bainbridge TaxID=2995303 RepID=A0ABT5EB42_9BACT|nr:alpha/beta hydrolase [Nannocystis bainbridge]MDC0722820.1 alpha/beta hydrolase [Nannocystis bainbridge]
MLAVLAVLAVVGAVYQQIGQALDRRAVVRPGRMVAVDGAAMHIHCTGAGAPTVVLEAGAFGFAQVWARVQPLLAERVRVCSYDRAGLGWSEDAASHDGIAAVTRLRTLLAAAGEPGPYVLVGHSLGGALIRIFAARYPDDVVGLGFVDPSHPDQLERFPAEAREAHERVTKILAVAAKLSHFGLLRLTNPLGRLHAGLPADDYRAARMFNSAARHLASSAAEFGAWDATMRAVRVNDTLGNRPVVVMSSSEPMEGMSQDIFDRGQQMHAEIARLSTRGQHRIVEASHHMSLLTEPEHAQRVAELLGEMIAEAALSPDQSPP